MTSRLPFSTADILARSLSETTEFGASKLKQILKDCGYSEDRNFRVVEVENPRGGKNVIYTNLEPWGHKNITHTEAINKIQVWYPHSGPGFSAFANNRGQVTHLNPEWYPLQILMPLHKLIFEARNFSTPDVLYATVREIGQLISCRINFMYTDARSTEKPSVPQRTIKDNVVHQFILGLMTPPYKEEDLHEQASFRYSNQLTHGLFSRTYESMVNDMGQPTEASAATLDTHHVPSMSLECEHSVGENREISEEAFFETYFQRLSPPTIDPSQLASAPTLNKLLKKPVSSSLLAGFRRLSETLQEGILHKPLFIVYKEKGTVKLGIADKIDTVNPLTHLALTIADYMVRSTNITGDHALTIFKSMLPLYNKTDVASLLFWFLCSRGHASEAESGLSVEDLMCRLPVVDTDLRRSKFSNPYGLVNLQAVRQDAQPYFVPDFVKEQKNAESQVGTAGLLAIPIGNGSVSHAAGARHKVVSHKDQDHGPRDQPQLRWSQELKTPGDIPMHRPSSLVKSSVIKNKHMVIPPSASDEVWIGYSSLAHVDEEGIVVNYRNPLQKLMVFLMVSAGVNEPPPYQTSHVRKVCWLLRYTFRVGWTSSNQPLEGALGNRQGRFTKKPQLTTEELERRKRTATQMTNLHTSLLSQRDRPTVDDAWVPNAMKTAANYKQILESQRFTQTVGRLIAEHITNPTYNNVHDILNSWKLSQYTPK